MGRRRQENRPVRRIAIRIGARAEIFPLECELLPSRSEAVCSAHLLHGKAAAFLREHGTLPARPGRTAGPADADRAPVVFASLATPDDGRGRPPDAAFAVPRSAGSERIEWPILVEGEFAPAAPPAVVEGLV
jgi:hypothetical protein